MLVRFATKYCSTKDFNFYKQFFFWKFLTRKKENGKASKASGHIEDDGRIEAGENQKTIERDGGEISNRKGGKTDVAAAIKRKRGVCQAIAREVRGQNF